MMKIYYENSQGVQLDLLKSPYRLQTGNIFDYKWSYSHRATVRKTAKIKGFSKDLEEKNLLLSILNYGKQAYYNAINFFAQTTEFDVVNNSPGKLYVGDMYLRCFIIASEKTEWESGIELLDNEITLVTDYPFWIKEITYQYLPEKPNQVNYSALETDIMFPEFPFDFAPVHGEKILENPSFKDSNFILTIYGFAENPQITISGHPYKVETTVYEGERLVIDSIKDTVKKIGRLGEITNCYNARGKQKSVFQKIPPGMNTFQWSGGFGIDITLFDERSEPKWSL